jgi:predicted nucleic acid-binding protein
VVDVVLDTSVWIAALRDDTPGVKDAVDDLLAKGRVGLCGPVLLELRQGLRPRERPILSLLDDLPYLEAERVDWERAGDLVRELRAKGLTLPGSDMLIAALCVRHDCWLLTLDKHFDHVPKLKRMKLPARKTH